MLWLVFLFTSNLAIYQKFQSVKGIIFIFITGIFLFFLLKKNLRTAVKKEEFKLYYQPKININENQNKISGVEALIRWDHPTLGPVSPQKFIKIAEESFLIREIGEWVVEKAFKQLSSWQNKYDRDLSISVNLSPLELCDKNKIDTLKIDKSFIGKLSDSKNMILIDSIIELSHKMNLKVIAEGIESSEQLKTMKKLKCDEIQGYYFYKPLPVNQFEKIIEKNYY